MDAAEKGGVEFWHLAVVCYEAVPLDADVLRLGVDAAAKAVRH